MQKLRRQAEQEMGRSAPELVGEGSASKKQRTSSPTGVVGRYGYVYDELRDGAVCFLVTTVFHRCSRRSCAGYAA